MGEHRELDHRTTAKDFEGGSSGLPSDFESGLSVGNDQLGGSMKNGKKPTREQRKLMQKWNVSTENWLVAKDTPELMLLVHRYTNTTKEIRKGERYGL